MKRYRYDQIIAQKPIEVFSKNQLENMNILSVNKDSPPEPFGSAVYRIQKYPGDLDLIQDISGKSVTELTFKFVKIIQNIVRKILRSKNHYFSEFKAGYDLRYDPPEKAKGTILHGVYKPGREAMYQYSKDLYDRNLLSDKEFNVIKEILRVQNPGADEYEVMKYIFRERFILRWSAKEILRGYKILPGNLKRYLIDCLTQPSPVKIDMITMVDNMLVEVTNFYILAEDYGNGRYDPINLKYDFYDPDQKKDIYDEDIKFEIEKWYYSNIYYNPFKAAKRMWAYSRQFDMQNEVEKLTPLISGDVSYLYQIKSEIDVILRLYKLGKNPKFIINRQVDLMKQKLSNIPFISQETLLDMAALIDYFVKTNSQDTKEKILKVLKDMIVKFVNTKTIQELDRLHLNPPPKKFYLDDFRYEIKKRGPFDIIENPLEKYGLK